jgi:small subunit ribosomal protein S3Ae
LAGKKGTKVVDKWKSKKWYTALAPTAFESKVLGDIISSDEKNMPGRIIKRSLMELGMGQSSQIAMFTNLYFRVSDVKGANANTKIIGHEIAPSYIKTFARRGKSLIHEVVDVKTKDGETVRIKVIAVTGAKVSENTRRNIRKALVEEIRKVGEAQTFDELMLDLVYGRFSSKMFNRLRQITMMRRVEVRKSERHEAFK